jgi:replicative DNA helicase
MEKSLPADINAERAVLGSVMLERDAIIAIAPWLPADYFYLEKHAWIYEAMLACYNRRIPPDLSTVADELRRNDRLTPIGGIAYLGELAAEVPTAVHVEYYAHIVERTAILRRLIQVGGTIAGLGYQEDEELENTLDKAEAELFTVSQRRATQEFVHIGKVVDAYFEQINYLNEHRGEVVGVPTGYRDLDELTGGLQPSDLIILAARPSVGKTSLALSIAYNVALQAQGTVGVFSLEMSREQLVQRLLAMHTGIDTQRLRTGTIHDRDLQVVMEAMGVLSALAVYIEDTPGLSIMEVRSRARRLQSEVGIDLLVIDYLQLMQGRRTDNRVQEVSEISRGLKALARELNVPVLALSQLSRAVEGRTSHVPMLSDLRESGCLAGESLVYLPDEGVYRRIDELVGTPGFRVLALNTETWKMEPRPVTHAFSTGVKPVYRLTTRLGRSIRATGNHKFRTIAGWCRLDQLVPGQRLALPRQVPGYAKATMNNDEIALLGLLIGDGCTLARQPIHFTTADTDIAEIVSELTTRVFGTAVTSRINPERTWYQVYLTVSMRLTHGVRNPVAAWLDSLDVFNLRSHEKRVPERIFAQPNAEIAHFLCHLWATDGCIHLSSNGRHAPTIYYATSSERLARDVQSLLLRLGINAVLCRRSQAGKGRDQFHVMVSGTADQRLFMEIVGAVGLRKQAQIKLVQAYLAQRTIDTNRDVIPREIWRTLVMPAALGNAYCGTALYKQNVSRNRAERLARVVNSEQLWLLAQSDVYWDEVVTIEPDGEALVYDLTVEGLHNFVANDMTVHNSIEQDADIVMFIYREELYDKETDKKGIAEVHLAKHRNGPLGVVPLRFENNTTQFQNLERYRVPEGY